MADGKGQGALSLWRLSAAFGWRSAVAVRGGWAARRIGGIGSLAETPRIFQAVGASFYLTGSGLRQQVWIRTSSQRKTRNMATQLGQAKVALVGAGIICAAWAFAPLSNADPTEGHFVNVQTASPSMRCEVGSDDRDGGGPAVVCQTAGFPQAPMGQTPYPGWHGDPSVLHQDQAIVTASGQFSWRTANLGMAPPGQPDIVLVDGQTYDFQGWTIVPTGHGTTFTNDATGHGMTIDSGYNVKSR